MQIDHQLKEILSELIPVEAYAETIKSNAMVAQVRNVEDCQLVLEHAQKNQLTICPRGGGYTYGDMILNNGQIILDISQMNTIKAWDSETGRILVEPGVSFADIFRLSLTANWLLRSCPGGMGVTIGGAISNNVHGKDNIKNGNFGTHVRKLKLLLADGNILSVGPEENSDIYKAIVGGMGMLGIIIEAEIQLEKVPSPFVRNELKVAGDIEELLGLLDESSQKDDFSVTWVDSFPEGAAAGRGYLSSANWIETNKKASAEELATSLAVPTKVFGVLPAKPFWFCARPMFKPASLRWVNEVHYLLKRLRGKGHDTPQLYTDYNFMHNKIPEFKHVYRPLGFLEYQPILPRENGKQKMKELLQMCHRFGTQSLLCGAKIHRADDFLISYEGDGYSIGVDIQIANRTAQEIETFSREIFKFTHECGGKVCLSKDEKLNAEEFKIMYPKYVEFEKIKERLDPGRCFSSGMYRRLFGHA
jgi:decaprenylphospho-beta-D-ribofuranose 2-oxidase